MRALPEGVQPYPRWRGTLGSGDRWLVVAETDVRRAYHGTWTMAILVLGVGWGLASVVEVMQLRQGGTGAHQLDWFVGMVNQLRWFALAMAAALGGPALLEDARRGALELYLSRSVGPRSYLIGKSAAVLALTSIILVAPIALYYLGTLIFFDQHPEGWHYSVFPALAYALGWAVMVTGLALGVSSVARSSSGAALILFGIFAGLDIVVSRLLAGLTGEAAWALLSPFAAYEQTLAWLFPSLEAAHGFPVWWGGAEWLVLTLVGWALVVRYRPRLRGDERGRP